MVKAIRIHAHGGPDVMQWEEIELPPPCENEVCVRHTAIGVNYSDINVRQGGFYLSPPLQFPIILGNEAAGIVESCGQTVTSIQPGDRVAYVGMNGAFFESTGAYAEKRNVPAERLIKLPPGLSDQQAAASMLKGLTAYLVINRKFRPKTGDTVLIHAAASGVGLILCQWSKHLGAKVIGTVGSREKAQLASEHGCDHPILYREVNFVGAVKQIAPQGVSAVFDGAGKDTFVASLECVEPFGTLVNYGNASGPVPPLDIRLLGKSSLSVCRVGAGAITGNVERMRTAAADVFDLVLRDITKIWIDRKYALRDAAQAHCNIESRKTSGSIVLLP
jgi:NADPH:quinone reductase